MSLRIVPSVDEVLRSDGMAHALDRFGHAEIVDAVRDAAAHLRETLRTKSGERAPQTREQATYLIGHTAVQALERANQPALVPVLNLTGTVLHTNLGRASYSETAVASAVVAMRSPVALEFDLQSGKRGDRDGQLRSMICALTGAEDACIVNNNAAAVLLVLAAHASGRQTIVSRGELIEIGGSFRIPAIMESAGTHLVEVGTTNRTHPHDYQKAVCADTALMMKVHTSNYLISGFTAAVSTRQLTELAQAWDLPVVEDMGSGTLVDLSGWGLARERTVRDAIADGADLVTFSGDKLLGGPQAGIIVGRQDLVQACAKHPLKRALRLDKVRMAALDATLRAYRNIDKLDRTLPTMRLLSRPTSEIRALAEPLRDALATALGDRVDVEICDVESQIGSGALPLETIPSVGLRMTPNPENCRLCVEMLAARFRALPVPVIGRIKHGALVLDLRCLTEPHVLLKQLNGLQLADEERRRPAS